MNDVKSVAITGATGMIGATLIRELIKDNISVIAVVRPNSNKLKNIPKHNLVKVIECYNNNLEDLLETKKNCDVFYHFAWEGTFGESRNDCYLQTENVKHTLDAVKLACAWGCHTFIGAGSQAEYGRVNGLLSPLTPINPENGYGIAKYTAGKLSAIAAKQLNMRHIWTRILSVYGPMDSNFTMVMSTIHNLINGKKTSYTAGDQIWDYLYSEDAAKAFYLLAKFGKDQSVYPIGSGIGIPLKNYIMDIRDAVNPHCEIGLGELAYNENTVMYLCADVKKLTNDTGFTPKISFKEGIMKTLKWYKEQIL